MIIILFLIYIIKKHILYVKLIKFNYYDICKKYYYNNHYNNIFNIQLL
jgi:hypothetical protein